MSKYVFEEHGDAIDDRINKLETYVGGGLRIQLEQQLNRRLRVTGAGSDQVNGVYIPDDYFLNKPRWKKIDDNMWISWANTVMGLESNEWQITDSDGTYLGTKYYVITSDATDPPVRGWGLIGLGLSPPPRLEWMDPDAPLREVMRSPSSIGWSAPLRIAVIGAGIFARSCHIPTILSLKAPPASIVAVYSRSESSASLAAKDVEDATGRAPLVYYDCAEEKGPDLEALLAREDIDAVTVALPISVQPDIIRRVIAAGKHVLSEKAIGPTLGEGLSLIKDYTPVRASVLWCVNENWRVEAGIVALRQMVRAGSIGKVQAASFSAQGDPRESRYGKTEWRKDSENGGHLVDAGVHYAAGLRCILGEAKLSTLQAVLQSRFDDIQGPDTVSASVEFRSGVLCTIQSVCGTCSRKTVIEVSGSKGSATLERAVQGEKPGYFLTLTGRDDMVLSRKFYSFSGHGSSFSHFTRAVQMIKRGRSVAQAAKTTGASLLSPEEALRDLEFIETIRDKNCPDIGYVVDDDFFDEGSVLND